jgi:hypothetical protein
LLATLCHTGSKWLLGWSGEWASTVRASCNRLEPKGVDVPSTVFFLPRPLFRHRVDHRHRYRLLALHHVSAEDVAPIWTPLQIGGGAPEQKHGNTTMPVTSAFGSLMAASLISSVGLVVTVPVIPGCGGKAF